MVEHALGVPPVDAQHAGLPQRRRTVAQGPEPGQFAGAEAGVPAERHLRREHQAQHLGERRQPPAQRRPAGRQGHAAGREERLRQGAERRGRAFFFLDGPESLDHAGQDHEREQGHVAGHRPAQAVRDDHEGDEQGHDEAEHRPGPRHLQQIEAVELSAQAPAGEQQAAEHRQPHGGRRLPERQAQECRREGAERRQPDDDAQPGHDQCGEGEQHQEFDEGPFGGGQPVRRRRGEHLGEPRRPGLGRLDTRHHDRHRQDGDGRGEGERGAGTRLGHPCPPLKTRASRDETREKPNAIRKDARVLSRVSCLDARVSCLVSGYFFGSVNWHQPRWMVGTLLPLVWKYSGASE